MWLIAEYHPASLFSFRSGIATSSGAKTLFLPTPFAIRMALLDAAIRTYGAESGPEAFEWIKRLSIAVRPPERVVVTNLFAKVLKPSRKDEAKHSMARTIAFREYAHLEGNIGLAFCVSEEQVEQLSALLAQINYFGKRGSFFQLLRAPYIAAVLPLDFVLLDGIYIQGTQLKGAQQGTFAPGLVQIMDDWGETLTFAKANIYCEEEIKVGTDRVRKTIVLPYRLVRASKGYSYYERLSSQASYRSQEAQ